MAVNDQIYVMSLQVDATPDTDSVCPTEYVWGLPFPAVCDNGVT